jgi:hypothetical protein
MITFTSASNLNKYANLSTFGKTRIMKIQSLKSLSFIFLLSLLGNIQIIRSQISAVTDTVVKFTVSDPEQTLINNKAIKVSNGNTNIYIGTVQVTANNQDPIIAKFTNGQRDWARKDYEVTGTDGRGYGLLWDGDSKLYAAFTVDGTQGAVSEDFRRFCGKGWLPSYGQGGGAKATVILQIDVVSGAGVEGSCTFITARLSSGNTNTLVPKSLGFDGDNIVVEAESYYSPLRTNKTVMNQTSIAVDSPFNYRIVFDATLQNALSAEAIGWDGVTSFTVLGAVRYASSGFVALVAVICLMA